MTNRTESLLQCREEIKQLIESQIDKFTAERRKARKKAVRQAMLSGFLEGFFSLGDGLAAIGGSLCGGNQDALRDRVNTNTHRIMDRSYRDWEKAYIEFWKTLWQEEDAIAVKYGFAGRDDFYARLKTYQETVKHDDAEQSGSTRTGADDSPGPDYTREI